MRCVVAGDLHPKDLWGLCDGERQVAPMQGEMLRVVESQEQVATTALVDDLAEQALLEGMLDASKPARRPGTERMHDLLATPFRYPPLGYGSRFGRRFEPSLFYGARRERTALSETAYYRLVFWTAMAEPPPSGRLLTQHTLFSVRFRSKRSLRLQDVPCDDHRPDLIDPADYRVTQALGSAMRSAGVEVFSYLSARDPEQGLNFALFVPEALVSRKPLAQQSWLCETRAGRVSFRPGLGMEMPSAVLAFATEVFCVDGRFPLPVD